MRGVLRRDARRSHSRQTSLPTPPPTSHPTMASVTAYIEEKDLAAKVRAVERGRAGRRGGAPRTASIVGRAPSWAPHWARPCPRGRRTGWQAPRGAARPVFFRRSRRAPPRLGLPPSHPPLPLHRSSRPSMRPCGRARTSRSPSWCAGCGRQRAATRGEGRVARQGRVRPCTAPMRGCAIAAATRGVLHCRPGAPAPLLRRASPARRPPPAAHRPSPPLF